MDKNKIIGVLLLVSAIGLLIYQQSTAPKPEPQPPAEYSESGETIERASGPPPAEELVPATPSETAAPRTATPAPAAGLYETVSEAVEGEVIEVLSNEFFDVHFTNQGGAVAEAVLKKYPIEKDSDVPYVLNALRAAPALSLLDFPGADQNTAYKLASVTADTITWVAQVSDQMEVIRTYSINDGFEEGSEPYLIRHETTFRNLTSSPVNTPKLAFSLGTAEPVDAKDPGLYLNVGAYDGDDVEFVGRGDFEPGFFKRTFSGDTVIKQEIPIPQRSIWASVKNQFFTTVVTADEPGQGVTTRRVEFPMVEGEAKPRVGVTGTFFHESRRVEAGESITFGFDLYAGPKEYGRLVGLGKDQDRVMQFGFFGFFSKILLTLLTALHGVVGNWGFAIVCTTLVIRGLMWPLTASAAKSAKRMGKIQGPMKELQEKYKDNRQKQQEEMLKLFKEHRINPLGSCLPMFVQLPIFFGLFRMLQSASELRFAEFLWVADLSQADTIGHIYGLPINIMPLLMGASMVVQMRMTPTPSTDNASAKMMKFMPYMVTAICYTFSSGLAVYWTASNLFSIFQQWVTNRRKDPVEAAPVATTPSKKAKAKAKAKTAQPGQKQRLGPKGLPVQKKKKR